jgi:OmpA-OmpF porin, OOP family
MTMKSTLLFSAMLLLGMSANAQVEDKNLVKNGSFEATSGKLKKLKQINVASDWISPTGLNADLYSTSNKEGETSINNPKGTEQPAEGKNYAGIVAFSFGDKEPRTYIQTELIGPLKAGMKYCVRFDLSLSDNSKYAVNNIGANVSKRAINAEDPKTLLLETSVKHSKNKIFNATYGWETVCGVFEATGGEKFLTIGNFSATKETKNEKVVKPKGSTGQQLAVAYYYIDNVMVFPLDSIQECQCEKGAGVEAPKVIYDEGYTSNKEFTLEEKIAHEKIYFDQLSTTVGDINLAAINSIVKILTENPDVVIEIHAYADKTEVDAAKNNESAKDLAKKRGEAVMKQLEKAGISPGRMVLIVENEKNPASTGTTETDKAKNRRVEFQLRK